MTRTSALAHCGPGRPKGSTLKSPYWTGTLAVLLLFPQAKAWDLFLSGSQGYTHYEAKDLNRIMTLLENTTQKKAGFNNYNVSRFDGHPQNALTVGFRQGRWKLGLEAEFWVEDFRQTEVPFDLEGAERLERITCDDLRAREQEISMLAGCVEANETFAFLPVTLQGSYEFPITRKLKAGLGYGLGIMAGSASFGMRADYIGKDLIPDDEVEFVIHPGINPVQKFFLDLEYLPWRFLGLSWRSGWRVSNLEMVSMREKRGNSQVFNVVFPDSKEGARLYIQSFPGLPGQEQLYLGTEAEAKARAASTRTFFHQANGDFTGWFLALKLNLYWRDL